MTMITTQPNRSVEVFDLHPTPSDFMQDVQKGLSLEQKRLPSMYFYDARGSSLFDRICELDEYYPTRTEVAILGQNATELAECVGERCMLVELGSGSSDKTRTLLRQLRRLHSYVPVDISKQHLSVAASRIAKAFPELAIYPVCADFMRELKLPPTPSTPNKKMVFFPGSTIGNFGPVERRGLLRSIAALSGAGGSLLIGIDLQKDRLRLERAYNDEAGVTGEFNLNLLRRINRELGADFDVDAFDHQAVYEETRGRIEMHLVSRRSQQVTVGRRRFLVERGESICTEYSYKFTSSGFLEEAAEAGFFCERSWTDPDGLFSVVLLTVARDGARA